MRALSRDCSGLAILALHKLNRQPYLLLVCDPSDVNPFLHPKLDASTPPLTAPRFRESSVKMLVPAKSFRQRVQSKLFVTEM
jgi:hypothetical protein